MRDNGQWHWQSHLLLLRLVACLLVLAPVLLLAALAAIEDTVAPATLLQVFCLLQAVCAHSEHVGCSAASVKASRGPDTAHGCALVADSALQRDRCNVKTRRGLAPQQEFLFGVVCSDSRFRTALYGCIACHASLPHPRDQRIYMTGAGLAQRFLGGKHQQPAPSFSRRGLLLLQAGGDDQQQVTENLAFCSSEGIGSVPADFPASVHCCSAVGKSALHFWERRVSRRFFL